MSLTVAFVKTVDTSSEVQELAAELIEKWKATRRRDCIKEYAKLGVRVTEDELIELVDNGGLNTSTQSNIK